MPEQRNRYKGSPLRPWVRLVFGCRGWDARDIEALADTGNLCALIVGQALLRQFNLGLAPGMSTNFGALDGGWLRIQIPLLSLLEYGGDRDCFWLRSS